MLAIAALTSKAAFSPSLSRTSVVHMQEAGTKLPMVGDYGFDPLGLGTEETLVPFREAELKHGRLAMLAAVAWPMQEIFHPIIVDAMRSSGWDNTRDMLAATEGKSPSLLNGGLSQWELAPVLSLAVFSAAVLELQDLRSREAQGLKFNEYSKDRQPGDFGFDPLNIAAGLPLDGQRDFQEKELLNGRVAMVAVACYVLSEFVFDLPVIRFTPDLFRPLIFAPDFRAFLDDAFRAGSMDGSIDGVAF